MDLTIVHSMSFGEQTVDIERLYSSCAHRPNNGSEQRFYVDRNKINFLDSPD
jgi:hypothetical protein